MEKRQSTAKNSKINHAQINIKTRPPASKVSIKPKAPPKNNILFFRCTMFIKDQDWEKRIHWANCGRHFQCCFYSPSVSIKQVTNINKPVYELFVRCKKLWCPGSRRRTLVPCCSRSTAAEIHFSRPVSCFHWKEPKTDQLSATATPYSNSAEHRPNITIAFPQQYT